MTVIYGFDSNRNTVEADLVAWYLHKEYRIYVGEQGNANPILAFFHIPVPEFKEAIIDLNARFMEPGRNVLFGEKHQVGLMLLRKTVMLWL